MPYLQLDTPYSLREQKQKLATRLGEIYSQTMNSPHRLTVAIGTRGNGNIWRCGEQDPRPADYDHV